MSVDVLPNPGQLVTENEDLQINDRTNLKRALQRLAMRGVIVGGVVLGVSFLAILPDTFGIQRQDRQNFEAQFPQITYAERQTALKTMTEYGRLTADEVLAGRVVPTPDNSVLEAKKILDSDLLRVQKEEELSGLYEQRNQWPINGMGIGLLVIMLSGLTHKALSFKKPS